MKPVREVVSREIIDDLWGAGYTILPRKRHPDPFFVPPEMVPATRSYQWWHLVHDRGFFGGTSGWSAVPASRHDGYFMPAGHVGDIEVSGLGLFEKPKFEVDAERRQQPSAVEKQVTDWIDKNAAFGISGSVSFGDQTATVGDPNEAKKFAPFVTDAKTVETTVKIPKDMLAYVPQIFEERDKLVSEVVNPDRSLKPGKIADRFYAVVDADKSAPWWPTLYAILLPLAIDRVREMIKPFSTTQDGEKS